MLHYSIKGEGSIPVIVLHGFLGSGRNLTSLAVRWSEQNPSLCFYLVDLTGHGSSPPLAETADLTSLAKDVWQLCSTLKHAGPFILLGHSLGGRVALKMAELALDNVSKVMVLDVSPAPNRAYSDIEAVVNLLKDAPEFVIERQEMRQYFIERGLSPALTDWLLLNLQREENGYSWRIERKRLVELPDQFRQNDLWLACKLLKQKLTCIRGGRSDFVTDEDVKLLQSYGCVVHTIEDAGHFVHVDQLNEVVEILKKF